MKQFRSNKRYSLKQAESLAANLDTSLYIDSIVFLDKSLCLQYLRQDILDRCQTDTVLRYLGLGQYRHLLINDIIRKKNKNNKKLNNI